MSKLSSGFWNGQASEKKQFDKVLVDKTRFVADYFNLVTYQLLEQFVGFNAGRVLKTDLWNESVSVEREVLAYYNGSVQVGTDISGVVCRGAYGRNNRMFVSQGDIRNLPFRDGAFDVILDISTIDHVSEADAVKVIAEYQRLLAAGGVLFLMYAQKYPFARHYWNNAFAGVYLLNAELINSCVAKGLVSVDDRGLDFIHGLFGVGPMRLFERFIVWHCPNWIKRVIVAYLFRLERSFFSRCLKGYCGLRVNIAVKRGNINV